MITLLTETEEFQTLIQEGIDEDYLKDIMKGFMGDRTGSELDAKVQYINSIPGCYGLIIQLFELFGKYPNYTQEFKKMEAAIARAKAQAKAVKDRENRAHRISARQNIEQNKELAKILKGGC